MDVEVEDWNGVPIKEEHKQQWLRSLIEQADNPDRMVATPDGKHIVGFIRSGDSCVSVESTWIEERGDWLVSGYIQKIERYLPSQYLQDLREQLAAEPQT